MVPGKNAIFPRKRRTIPIFPKESKTVNHRVQDDVNGTQRTMPLSRAEQDCKSPSQTYR